MKLIGITGGIGTGKSTATRYLKEKGYKVVDFDKISRYIYLKKERAYINIIDEFGNDILDKNGEIDRKKLANIVFSDSEKLKSLEKIVHKEIYRRAKDIINSSSDEEIIFLDIPLLFETEEYLERYNMRLEEIWLIYADREKQIERVIKRDSISREAAIKRIDAQMDIDQKVYKSDKIIYNHRGKDQLYNEIDKALSSIESQD